jgi:hypothetical protein
MEPLFVCDAHIPKGLSFEGAGWSVSLLKLAWFVLEL